MKKIYTGVGQATDDNMAHAHVTLDSKGYKHIFKEYVIILAFPQQQLLHERAAMLRSTYIACLVLSEYQLSFFKFVLCFSEGQTEKKNLGTFLKQDALS